MYDFYPEWGPTRHRDPSEPQPAVRRPRYWQGATSSEPGRDGELVLAGAPERRDAENQRPDDN